MTERSWWGWGTTDRALTDDECVAAAAGLPGLPDRPRAVPAVADLVLPDAADRAAPRAAGVDGSHGARVPHLRQGLPGRRPRAGRRPARGTGRRGLPGLRGRRRPAPRLGGVGGAGRRPLRRRQLGGRRRRVPRRAARGCRWTSPGWTACSRWTRSAGPRGSRAARSARSLEDQLRPHGLHAAALPAELRVLHARRLAGHPRRRPLRDAAHPHRRPRRVDAGGHADRESASRGGCPGRAPARRRTGCSSARRARSASSPRRGCGCRTGPGSRRRPSVRLPDDADGAWPPSGRSRSRRSTRPTAGCSTPARRRSPAPATAGARARARASNRPTIPVDEPARRARWTWPATTAALPERRGRPDRRRHDGRRRLALGVPAHARTSATGWRGMSAIVETFETACTWDRLPTSSTRPSAPRWAPRSSEVTGGPGW